MRTILFAAFLFGHFHLTAQTTPTTWKGTLDVNSIPLELFIEIGSTSGQPSTLSVPAQGLSQLPADRTTVKNDSVILHFTKLGVRINGVFSEPEHIKASFHQNGYTLDLHLKPYRKESEHLRPQTPKPPFPYSEKEATIKNKAAGITLKGTYTLPKGRGPFPAVVLISGSGPQDRSMSIAGHEWFTVLTDALARKGIAVLRFDDRGTGASEGEFSGATTKDHAEDAHAALTWLLEQPETDKENTGYLGHSEGGLAALMAEKMTPKPSFMVLMATPATPGLEFMLRQKFDIETAMGIPEPTAHAASELFRKLYEEIIAHPAPKEERKDRIAARLNTYTANTLPQAHAEQIATALSSDWMTSLLQLQPGDLLQDLNTPLLALYGSKDLLVNASINAAALDSLLPGKLKQRSRIETLNGLNHLFQPATTGLPREYTRIETTLSPEALQITAEWLLKR